MDIKQNTIEFSKFIVFFILCSGHNCLFASSGAANEVMCKQKERDALLTFKQGLILHYGAVLLPSWGSEEDKKECCEWEGVLCINSTGYVISLSLQYLYGGGISPSLLELPHLQSLDLSQNDFGGDRIPEFFGSLPKLKHLNLHSCNFSGEVPYQLGNLTNLRTLDLGENYGLTSNNLGWISNLTLLSQLDLSANRFAGVVPDFKEFSSLRELRLNQNKLTELPTSTFQLSELEVLDLSHNHLQGTISEVQLSNLPNLKVLDLSFSSLAVNLTPDWIPPFQLDEIRLASCDMGPRFPTWLQTQNNFSHLDLSSNRISDEVPNWLLDLSPEMSFFNLSRNQISGSIPALSSKSLDRVDISSNNFSGPLPLFDPNIRIIQVSQNMFDGSIQSLCRVKYDKLGKLDLSRNQFSGELPNCWENMSGLIMLNLADNKFSGHLPQSLGSLIYLRILNFRNNNLTGELPSTLQKCSFLQFIDGGGNELIGTLPTWMGMLTDLAFLILRQNSFYGSIPPQHCSLTIIQVLDLSQNDISGRIPQCFENFTSFVLNSTSPPDAPFLLVGVGYDDFYGLGAYVNDATVQWKRQKSEYKNTLGLLKLIDLSSNKLIGNIPREVFRLSGLVSLNLSRNHLTGTINSDIDEMKMLESLDLSGNNLSGEIPVSLAKLHYLSVLDLSSNNLTGKIPEGTQLQSFDASAYAGNKELCGPPLPNCPGDDPRPSAANRGNQEDEELIVQSYFEEYIISGVLGYIVGCWVIVGPLLFKRSWRKAYFGCLNKIGD